MSYTREELLAKVPKNPDDVNPPKNPALAVGITTTGIASIILLVFKYVVPDVSDEVLTPLALAVALFLPVIASWIIRGKVWSPASVQIVVDEAVKKALETAELLKTDHMKLIATDEPGTYDPEKPPFNK